MRALFDTGPAADQDAIAAATVINNISLTVAERSGPVLLIANIGFTDTDALAVVTTLEMLQEGVVLADATQLVETGAVDNLRCSATLMAVVENAAVAQTFTLRVTPAGTAVDVKMNNCSLLAIGLGQLGAEVANFVSP